MKTKIISTLKKELLIIELPTLETQISIGLHCIGIKPPPIGKEASDSNGFYHVYKEMFHGFKILGKPDEIKEEDVLDLVETVGKCKFTWKDYKKEGFALADPLKSFFSAIEEEITWVNPVSLERADYYRKAGNEFSYNGIMKCWNEAQEKTFDRNRTLIFVKN